MNREQLKRKFPNASETFLAANEDCCLSQGAKPKRALCNESVGKAHGEKGNPGRIRVGIVSYRKRLIDPDNLCPKYFIDCLRYAGIIPDDSAKHITLEVSQEMSDDERTEIEISAEDNIKSMAESSPVAAAE